MRVLHVHSGNLYGGVETLLVTLAKCRHLCPDMEPEFALCFEGRLSEELRAAGGVVHPLSPARVSRPWSVLAARRRLRGLLSSGGWKAMTHSPWSQALFGPTLRRARVPHALYVHGRLEGRHWLEWLARRSPPDLIIANSRFSAESVPVVFPGRRGEVAYLPIVTPPSLSSQRAPLRAALGAPGKEVVILQVSRMEPGKGHLLHLEALAELKDLPDWCCWMVGGAQRLEEKGYEAEMARRVEELGLSGRVQWLGLRGDMGALLAAADVACQPNVLPESFGVTFIEALSAGVPVVTTAMGGALEILDESCGVLVPPEAGRLAAALRRLIADAALRRRLGEAGPSRARSLCDPVLRLPRLAELLRGLGP